MIIQPNGPCSDYHGQGGGCEDHGLDNTVIIEHIGGKRQAIYSLYAHLDSINPSLHEGRIVAHCDPIGIMGASGYGLSDYWKNSDGTPAIYLHFEIKDRAVLSNPKSEGIHFGYVPSSADNYGYHNLYTFLNRVELVTTDEAKPLPNGVTIENLSIALSKIERRNYQTSPKMLDELNLEFIFRKIKPGGKYHKTNRIIFAEVIDDHYYRTTGIQYPDGRVAWIFPAATLEESFDVKILGLSEKTVEMHLPLGAAIMQKQQKVNLL